MTQSYSGVHFLDSGASTHYQTKADNFSSIQPMNGVVETASGEQCKIIGIGDAMVQTDNDKLTLSNARLTPPLDH